VIKNYEMRLKNMLEEILSITRKIYCNSKSYKYLLFNKVCLEWISNPQKVKITLAKDGTRKFLIMEAA